MAISELPIIARRQEIVEAIKKHQVVVVSGETGSGKTTQLPQICLALGRGQKGLIGHTQPRRIAARSVAARIADELGTQLGDLVGYQVRFTDRVGKNSKIKLMTDGILLAEIQGDPQLSKYDTIIIDEAHERSLNIDFLLGYLAALLPSRPDLKLIITSATIDAEKFAEHFSRHLGGKPVPRIEVSGRTYPVEIRYRPLLVDKKGHFVSGVEDIEEGGISLSDSPDAVIAEINTPTQASFDSESERKYTEIDQVEGICLAVDELCQESHDDILVFLSGERDIQDTEQGLKEHLGNRYVTPGGTSRLPGAIEVLPLYARLSPAEQQRIFQPHPYQRIILATNIAETSLTVPGIKYVIDPGFARISRYSNRTKVQRLPIEEISQASAKQRAGRCGRTSDGIAIRLYDYDNFQNRPEFTEPEILRTSLAAVILQMASLDLGPLANFPFIDAPDPRAIRDGEQLLFELGALQRTKPKAGVKKSNSAYRLTRLGWELARLPLDPTLGKMLLTANLHGCLSEVLVIVAALSMQDIRLRPLEAQEQADYFHNRFVNPDSDFLTYLTLWHYLRTQQENLSGAALRRLCHREFLHYLRWREWQDLTSQLRQSCRELGLKIHPLAHPAPASYQRDPRPDQMGLIEAATALSLKADTEAIHRSLLNGMLSNIGNYNQRKQLYQGTRGSNFQIWPGSGLANRSYDWVMSAELVETVKLFARNVAKISPQWVIEEAGHLLKRSYGEIFWSRSQAQAMIREKITLYGLTISADKPVPLASLKDYPVARPSGFSFADTQTFNPINLEGGHESVDPDAVNILTARELAREMFIRHALVEEDCSQTFPFQKHNRKVLERVSELQQRTRSGKLLADNSELVAFMNQRVGENVTNPGSFFSWWKRQKNPRLLNYSVSTVLSSHLVEAEHTPLQFRSGSCLPQTIEGRQAAEKLRSLHQELLEKAQIDYPENWHYRGLKYRLKYHFSPGAKNDGVTVQIPISQLKYLSAERFSWLVPGLRQELFTALIRGLPKEKRRQLAPAPQHGEKLWHWFENLMRQHRNNPQKIDLTPSDKNHDYQLVSLRQEAQENSRAAVKAEAELALSLERLANWAGITAPARPKTDSQTKQAGNRTSEDSAAGEAHKPLENGKTLPPKGGAEDKKRESTGKTEANLQSQKRALLVSADTAPPYLLEEVFSVGIDRIAGLAISPEDFAVAVKSLPSHLQMHFEILGAKVGIGTDLQKLQKDLAAVANQASRSNLQEILEKANRSASKMTTTAKGTADCQQKKVPAGEISPQVKTTQLTDWPRDVKEKPLVTLPQNSYFQGEGCGLQWGITSDRREGKAHEISLCSTDSSQSDTELMNWVDLEHSYGTAELLLFSTQLPTKRITSRWNRRLSLQLATLAYPDTENLVAALHRAAIYQLCWGKPPLRHAEQYLRRRSWAREQLEEQVYRVAQQWGAVVEAESRASKQIQNLTGLSTLTARQQLQEILEYYRQPGFLLENWPILAQIPRYLQALAVTAEKLAVDFTTYQNRYGQYNHALNLIGNGFKQLEKTSPSRAELRSLKLKLPGLPPYQFSASYRQYQKLTQLIELTEEYRVSVFAQQLGTAVKVSPQRIKIALTELLETE